MNELFSVFFIGMVVFKGIILVGGLLNKLSIDQQQHNDYLLEQQMLQQNIMQQEMEQLNQRQLMEQQEQLVMEQNQLLNDTMSNALDLSISSITPFELGGLNMDIGNSFNNFGF